MVSTVSLRATTLVKSFGALNLFTHKLALWLPPPPHPDTMLILMHTTKPQCLNFVLGGGDLVNA